MDLNKTFSEFPDEMSLDSQSFPKLYFGNISDISIHPYVVFNNNKRKISDLDSDPESTIPLHVNFWRFSWPFLTIKKLILTNLSRIKYIEILIICLYN